MARISKRSALKQYECGALPLTRHGQKDHYERHLVFDHLVTLEAASPRQRFEALARSLRDMLAQRWILTEQAYQERNVKRVHYLSMEFLIGRTLVNNIINLGVEDVVREKLFCDPHRDWTAIIETEPDAGLGNGGLGRLAACFMESLATLQIPAMGHGLRYEFGIFRQEITNGFQEEHPDNWLKQPDPWEVARPQDAVQISLGCAFHLVDGTIHADTSRSSTLLGVPYDRPVVGYGGQTINTLRLWSAESPECFDFGEFNTGDFVGAIVERLVADTVTRVLYPDDSTQTGQALRFVQEYFLVCCSLADIVAQFRRSNSDWSLLPDKAAIQMNDTHPAMAVAELMRILLDQAGLTWEQAWDLTVRTLAYTNHTLLPEALETWPVGLLERLLPRQMQLIYAINAEVLGEARAMGGFTDAQIANLSLIDEHGSRRVRMGQLAFVGSHSINGVSALHSELVKKTLFADLDRLYPGRINNKTNGVTPRRWLMQCNPELTKLIAARIGPEFQDKLELLTGLDAHADDPTFQDQFKAVKRANKVHLAQVIKERLNIVVSPDALFDVQVKRIHEYKRQLLNVIEAVAQYSMIRSHPEKDWVPRVKVFAGKAAPGYWNAKLIIKLINDVATVVNNDPAVRGLLKVVFLPNYNVSLAETIIPAADLSEQISTAGMEASGTGNMKFMANGAITIGTLDGANVEMLEQVGPENMMIFGLTADKVAEKRQRSEVPRSAIDNSPALREALEAISTGVFSPDDPNRYRDLIGGIYDHDWFMVARDFDAYAAAQRSVDEVWNNPRKWYSMAIRNTAHVAWFSSDRTITEYARGIWGVPVGG
ncbi:MAG TPA: glycogen/starch/alpha-glucan phosphorylase [Planctomycetaceae bacterium]|nr:glycogen/starch/alpha-glucan phosphorylase [Planctomycetaceae bacterium]